MNPGGLTIKAETGFNIHSEASMIDLRVINPDTGDESLSAAGSDPRGLMYSLLELADQVTHTGTLARHKATEEQPANRIRSIIRPFVSEVEDKAWFYDRDHWREYLTMLATNRFNRFSLTFGIGYDFTRE